MRAPRFGELDLSTSDQSQMRGRPPFSCITNHISLKIVLTIHIKMSTVAAPLQVTHQYFVNETCSYAKIHVYCFYMTNLKTWPLWFLASTLWAIERRSTGQIYMYLKKLTFYFYFNVWISQSLFNARKYKLSTACYIWKKCIKGWYLNFVKMK